MHHDSCNFRETQEFRGVTVSLTCQRPITDGTAHPKTETTLYEYYVLLLLNQYTSVQITFYGSKERSTGRRLYRWIISFEISLQHTQVLQEWNLLREGQVQNYDEAVQALRERLDPRRRVHAGQDFRYTAQSEGESVSDFVQRLERTFHVVYG